MTPEDRKRRAERAKELLDDPIVAEALAAMEKGILADFLACEPDDHEGRRSAQMALRVQQTFLATLRSVVNAGMQAVKTPIRNA